MHTKNGFDKLIINENKQLVSAFLTVSLMLNFVSPQPAITGDTLDTEITEKSILLPENIPFSEPISLEFEEYSDHLISGQTSFIAPKNPPNKKQVVVSRRWLFVTAYSSTVDQTDSTPFITASNSHVRDGIVAANFLRFGTKVRFPNTYGDKIFVVEDRMNSRYPYRVDIWMRSREEAKQFGAKIVLIEIIKEI